MNFRENSANYTSELMFFFVRRTSVCLHYVILPGAEYMKFCDVLLSMVTCISKLV